MLWNYFLEFVGWSLPRLPLIYYRNGLHVFLVSYVCAIRLVAVGFVCVPHFHRYSLMMKWIRFSSSSSSSSNSSSSSCSCCSSGISSGSSSSSISSSICLCIYFVGSPVSFPKWLFQ